MRLVEVRPATHGTDRPRADHTMKIWKSAAAAVGAMILASTLATTAAVAQSPNSLGQFNDWTAWTYTNNGGKICYIHSTPKSLKPESLRHGDVSFFIRKSPGENIINEANFVVGYPFQENSTVSVNVGGTLFTMFTQADSAWLLNEAEESNLLAAMKAGTDMTITGTSRRGNKTTYRMSLSGVTAAANKIISECN
jgi:hypothetical protein